MKVLGMDTSGYVNAVGVTDGDRVLADFIFEARTDSLEKIVTNIDYTLKEAGITLDDIDGFGVGLGPGSWTGIRVGVTVAKTLAFSTGRPVCGVSTLEVLAHGARDRSALICPVISAGTKDAVYAAFYITGDGTVTRKGEYYVGDIQGLSAMLKEPAVLVGPEARVYGSVIGQRTGSPDIEVIEEVPRGATVALLAAARLARGDSDDALSLTPLYLKESTARAFVNKYIVRARKKGQVQPC